MRHTCAEPGLTPAFVNRGRSKAGVIGDLVCAEEGREGGRERGRKGNTVLNQQEEAGSGSDGQKAAG